MVLPVLSLIHCGIGRFCFCALASLTFVLKVLWDCDHQLVLAWHYLLRSITRTGILTGVVGCLR